MMSGDHGDRGSRSTRGSSLVGSIQVRRCVSRSLSQPEEEMAPSATGVVAPSLLRAGGRRQLVPAPVTASATSILTAAPQTSSEHDDSSTSLLAGEVSLTLPSGNSLTSEPAVTSTWILSFGTDPMQPPAVRRHPDSERAPDLLCIAPLCILLPHHAAELQQQQALRGPVAPTAATEGLPTSNVPQLDSNSSLRIFQAPNSDASTWASTACGSSTVLYAAGHHLQSPFFSRQQQLKCLIRHRGHYLPNTVRLLPPRSIEAGESLSPSVPHDSVSAELPLPLPQMPRGVTPDADLIRIEIE